MRVTGFVINASKSKGLNIKIKIAQYLTNTYFAHILQTIFFIASFPPKNFFRSS